MTWDDQDGMTEDLIPERRPKQPTPGCIPNCQNLDLRSNLEKYLALAKCENRTTHPPFSLCRHRHAHHLNWPVQ
ncbi:hypothetical protein HAX54_029194, partial [Datura stramonium]|nr:hypothetical protein [Datura stramonium]